MNSTTITIVELVGKFLRGKKNQKEFQTLTSLHFSFRTINISYKINRNSNLLLLLFLTMLVCKSNTLWQHL